MDSSLDLYTRKRTLHGVELWWICRKVTQVGKRPTYIPYADIHSPTGYGFKSRAKAEKVIRDIEARINGKDTTHA